MKLHKSLIAVLIAGLGPAVSSMAYAEIPVENWLMVETDLDYAFVSENAPLVNQQRIFIDPINVWHPAEQDTQMAEANVAKLQKRFAKQVTQTLTRAGFTVLDAPQPGALRLHLEVIDLKLNPPSNGENPWKDRFMFEVSPGKLSFVAEVQDMDTQTVLLRLADHEKQSDDSISVWEQVDQQILSWSKQLAITLTPITEGDRRVAKR